jgi:hypothetical protein
VVAFVLGLLSLSLTAGAAAIVLGVVALGRIRRSAGQLTGRGPAMTGIILGLAIPLGWTWLEMHRSFATRMVCGSHLAGIGKAMQAYTEANDGKFPTPAKWCDLPRSSTAITPTDFQCTPYRQLVKMNKYPLERYFHAQWRMTQYLKPGACDFAMNPLAAGNGVPRDPNLVLAFETGPGWNQVAGPEALTADHHEGDGASILFQDMHVCFVKTQEFAKLRWKP